MYFIKKDNDNKKVNLMDEVQNFFTDSFFSSKVLKTDIIEKENEYLLKIDLPGVLKENINLEFNNQYLTLSVHQDEQKQEEDNQKYIRKERTSYAFSRSYYLDKADEENVKAKLENGILSINVGKIVEQQQNSKISIE